MKKRLSPPGKRETVASPQAADELLGEYSLLSIAHSTSQAQKKASASGGALTETLCHLLKNGQADGVICAGFPEGSPTVPDFVACRTEEEIRQHSGSIYAYLSGKQLIRALDASRLSRPAVVCQPCLVRLAGKWMAEHNTDGLTASFFCGYNMDLDATRFLIRKAGMKEEDIATIRYRDGEYPGGFSVTDKHGRTVRFGKHHYELINLQFLRKGCAACSLYMGEDADVAFGDAWFRGRRDLGVAMARTEKGREALTQCAAAGNIHLYELEPQLLVAMHFHNLKYKKFGHSLPMRALVALLNRYIPKQLVPFRLMGGLSKLRRSYKIGIPCPPLKRIGHAEK